MKTSKSVQEYGTLNHIFIHLKRSENELKSRIEETSTILNVKSVDEARFAINDTFYQAENADSFGKIDLTFNTPIYSNDCMNMNLLDIISIKNISLRHKKTMSFEFKVNAICMMDAIILLGAQVNYSSEKLCAVDSITGTYVTTINVINEIKRMAYDIESMTIFISSFQGNVFPCKIHQSKFVLNKNIAKGNSNNGGLCIFDGYMYVIADRQLKKIKIDNQETGLQKCGNIKTDCCNTVNGLAADVKNKRLLYTSNKNEVVATTTDGSEIFCYKDKHMNSVVSVAVNDQGCIIACDFFSALHVISEDGKQRKTLLNNFDKIKAPRDICFDKSGKFLFVCGGRFVEIYDILYY